MNEWEKARLGEVISFNPSEKITKGAKKKKIAMEKLAPFSKFISKYEIAEFNGGAKFRNGDTLLARITPCLENGKTSQVTILGSDEVGFGSTEFIVMRQKENISDKDFIFYLSISPQFRDIAIKSMVGSSGRQRIQQSVLDNTIIEFPPLMEQKRIAAILSAFDDKIELNNRMNKNLEAQAQAIFKSWFVDFEPWGGVMPEDWREGRVDDFFNISIGKTPPRKEPQWFTVSNKDVKWISISDMGNCGVFISDCSEYLTKESVNKFNVKTVCDNTVILSFKLTVGRVAITDGEMVTNEAIAHFNSNDENIVEYLYCYLKKFDYQTLGNTSSIATAVNSKTIKAMPFSLPNECVIKKFHGYVKPIMHKIKENSKQSQTLASLRDTLLPKLMSGEIDIKEEE